MTPDLTDDDKAILADLLREAIERNRFPMSPRVRAFKAILAKSSTRRHHGRSQYRRLNRPVSAA